MTIALRYICAKRLATASPARIERPHPEVAAARRAMIAESDPKRYAEAKGRYERLHAAAHQAVMQSVMEAPPNGANTYRQARETVQRRRRAPEAHGLLVGAEPWT